MGFRVVKVCSHGINETRQLKKWTVCLL